MFEHYPWLNTIGKTNNWIIGLFAHLAGPNKPVALGVTRICHQQFLQLAHSHLLGGGVTAGIDQFAGCLKNQND